MDTKILWWGMPLAAAAVVSGMMTFVYPLTDLPTEQRPAWPMFPSVSIPSTAGSRTAIDAGRLLGLS